jgi:hypothetical protein
MSTEEVASSNFRNMLGIYRHALIVFRVSWARDEQVHWVLRCNRYRHSSLDGSTVDGVLGRTAEQRAWLRLA